MSEVLNDVERKSAVWLKLKAHLEKRLAAQRAKNDRDLSVEDTAKARGRIAEIKELLALGDEPNTIPQEKFID